VLNIGHTPYFRGLSESAVNTLNAWKVKSFVTSDPHSSDAFINHYKSTYPNQPDLLILFRYTEFLWQIINDWHLTIKSDNPRSHHKITYWNKEDLQIKQEFIGKEGSPTSVSELIQAPENARKRIFLTRSTEEIVPRLIVIIKNGA
jgi:hypothetical protein